MANAVWCKSCGEKCLDTDSYCKNCHASLKTQDHGDDLPLEGIEIEKWHKFIGKNSSGYIKEFRKHEGKKIFASFNPAAWFFGSYWLLYRKMYIQAILMPIVTDAVAIVFAVLVVLIMGITGNDNSFLANVLMRVFAILESIAINVFINTSLYKAHVKKHITSPVIDFSRGGTSLTPCVVFPVLRYLFEVFIVAPLLAFIMLALAA